MVPMPQSRYRTCLGLGPRMPSGAWSCPLLFKRIASASCASRHHSSLPTRQDSSMRSGRYLQTSSIALLTTNSSRSCQAILGRALKSTVWTLSSLIPPNRQDPTAPRAQIDKSRFDYCLCTVVCSSISLPMAASLHSRPHTNTRVISSRAVVSRRCPRRPLIAKVAKGSISRSLG